MDFDHIGKMIGSVQNTLSFLLEKVLLLVLKHVKTWKLFLNKLEHKHPWRIGQENSTGDKINIKIKIKNEVF
jgi:hypothetical protein